MKKKLYLGLVISLITMPTIRAMDCTKDGFMCQTAYNCCNKLCNGFGFCHRGYPGTNLDLKDILAANPHLRPGFPQIQLNPAIFGGSGPILNTNPVYPGVYPGNTNPVYPGVYPGNTNPVYPGVYPGNTNPVYPGVYPGNTNPVYPGVYPGNTNPVYPGVYPTNYPTPNPPPNPSNPVDVFNDRPDSTPLRLHNF